MRGVEALNRRDWPAAVEAFRQGTALAPRSAPLHHRLGTALAMMGKEDEARREFEAAVAASPGYAKAHYSLGVLLEDRGNDEGALDRYAAAVQSAPDYAQARLRLADVLRRRGRLQDALTEYEQVMHADPTLSDAMLGRAITFVRMGRYREARDQLLEGLKAYPNHAGFPHALARLLAAAPDDSVRDGSRALALAEQVVKVDQSTDVGETLGMALAEVGRFEEAAAVQRDLIAAARQAGRPDLVGEAAGQPSSVRGAPGVADPVAQRRRRRYAMNRDATRGSPGRRDPPAHRQFGLSGRESRPDDCVLPERRPPSAARAGARRAGRMAVSRLLEGDGVSRAHHRHAGRLPPRSGIAVLIVGATRPYYRCRLPRTPLPPLPVSRCSRSSSGERRARGPIVKRLVAASIALVFIAVCSAALARATRDGDRARRYRITNPATVPATMEQEGGGPGSPFFPSSAGPTGRGVIPSSFFLASASCGRCHRDIYDQWNSSMHHFASFNNQWYRKSIEYMQDVVGTRPSKWCAGCHDHALLFSGRFDQPVKDAD